MFKKLKEKEYYKNIYRKKNIIKILKLLLIQVGVHFLKKIKKF